LSATLKKGDFVFLYFDYPITTRTDDISETGFSFDDKDPTAFISINELHTVLKRISVKVNDPALFFAVFDADISRNPFSNSIQQLMKRSITLIIFSLLYPIKRAGWWIIQAPLPGQSPPPWEVYRITTILMTDFIIISEKIFYYIPPGKSLYQLVVAAIKNCSMVCISITLFILR
jgi:hypothetical protein